MSKSIKPNDNTYIDSTGVVHNRSLLSIIIDAINSKLGSLLKSELVWTNPNPSAAFTGQVITISKSCEKVDIIYRTSKTDSSLYVRTVYNLNAYGNTIGLIGYNLCNRNVALNNNQVHFGNCEYIGTYGSASVNNDYMIPYKIIGYTKV